MNRMLLPLCLHSFSSVRIGIGKISTVPKDGSVALWIDAWMLVFRVLIVVLVLVSRFCSQVSVPESFVFLTLRTGHTV